MPQTTKKTKALYVSMSWPLAIGEIGKQLEGYRDGIKGFTHTYDIKTIKWNNPAIEEKIDRAKNNPEFDGGSSTQNGWFAIITDEEEAEIIEADKKAFITAEKAEKMQEIEDLEAFLKRYNRERLVKTRAEAIEKMKQYNNIFNEGGGGYVPRIISQEEYDAAEKQAETLKKEIQ